MGRHVRRGVVGGMNHVCGRDGLFGSGDFRDKAGEEVEERPEVARKDELCISQMSKV